MCINHVDVDSHVARRKNVRNLVILYLWKPRNGKLFSGLTAKGHQCGKGICVEISAIKSKEINKNLCGCCFRSKAWTIFNY